MSSNEQKIIYGGATTTQIGECVKIRTEFDKGSSQRITANQIIHANDIGVNNKYTDPSYSYDKNVQQFINQNKK